ncbi:MAG: hypothetical protein AAB662_02605 [Patescibacteria group bacterium]
MNTVETLPRTAIVIDRKGNTAPQGIFPGKEFRRLKGKYIELEDRRALRELTLCCLYNIFFDLSKYSSEYATKQFIKLMATAYVQAQNNQRQKENKPLCELAEEGTSFRILSNPKAKAARVEMVSKVDKIILDISNKDIQMKFEMGQWPQWQSRNMGIVEFLERESPDDNPEDLESTKERRSIGKELDQAIFGR